jgi:hypothetical protein
VSAHWLEAFAGGDHRFYLSLCLRAARALGEEFVVNFLESSFLGDGETSVRDYLAHHPQQTHILHPLTLAVDDEEMERIRACQTKRTPEEAARDNYAVQMTEIDDTQLAAASSDHRDG